MNTFREYSRVFFSIFLILTSFIGCCQSVTWMSELTNMSYDRNNYHVNERYGERYYPQEQEEEEEETVDTTQTTSESDEYRDYYERRYTNNYPY